MLVRPVKNGTECGLVDTAPHRTNVDARMRSTSSSVRHSNMTHDQSGLSEDEFQRALARDRRRLPMRLAFVGFLAILGGLGLASVGYYYHALQESSRVVFVMPVQLLISGLLVAGVGVLFLLVAAFLAWRGTCPPESGDRAQ
jgi:hypothetical protein